MAKTKISEYDSTAANNTDIDGINIAEGCAPSGINNAIRELMAHLKDGLGAGTPVYLDATNNRLGVGTTSPTSKLTVDTGGNATEDYIDVNSGGGNRLRLGYAFTTAPSTSQAAIVAADSSGNLDISSRGNAASAIQFYTSAGSSAAERMRIDSSGNVGIGTSLPDVNLSIAGSSASSQIQLSGSDTSKYNRIYGDNSGIMILSADAGNTAAGSSMRFNVDATERVRIDSSGNFLVGKTTTALNTTGSYIAASGLTALTTDSQRPLILNRKTNDGDLIEFNQDGSQVGSIKNSTTNIDITATTDVRIIGGSGAGFRTGSSSNNLALIPLRNSADSDNTGDIGIGSVRFDDIFATNGTIQTSDENEKQNIASLTSAEITAATAISKLFKTFKWKDKVEAKGDNARTHTGLIAQQVQSAMSDAGLDATKYAFWCSDTWWEKYVDVAAVEADEENGIEAKDAYTHIERYYSEEEAPSDATERTRLGVRYPELLAFIGAATEQRLTSIEARLDALEG